MTSDRESLNLESIVSSERGTIVGWMFTFSDHKPKKLVDHPEKSETYLHLLKSVHDIFENNRRVDRLSQFSNESFAPFQTRVAKELDVTDLVMWPVKTARRGL
jgi:hypothetical protein